MKENNKIALIIGFYLSRFDTDGVHALGFNTSSEAFEKISEKIQVKANSIRQMRDEFDPYCDNSRVGYKNEKLAPSRQVVYDKFSIFSFDEMTTVVKAFLEKEIQTDEIQNILIEISREETAVLKNLNELAKECKKKYQDEFKTSDVSLSDEFKHAFGTFIRKSGSSVDYNFATTMVTTGSNKKILVPNQWFGMAAFMADVVKELLAYKSHLDIILTNAFSTTKERKDFIVSAKDVFSQEQRETFKPKVIKHFSSIGDTDPESSTDFMLSFLSDYDWWFGSKTIDRSDFYVSPVLNLLNVVNVTQSYIADIANFYATDTALLSFVPELKQISSELKPSPTSKIDFNVPNSVSRKIGAENIIIYGAPGTGKSHLLEKKFGTEPFTKRVVFHPEYTYFDFVGAYKPVPVYKKNSGDFEYSDGTKFTEGEPYITYKFIPGPFIEVLVAALKDPVNMYTLMIEEINRANAAAVFGEVFQLLDRTSEGDSEYAVMPSEELRNYLIGTCKIVDIARTGIKIPSNMNVVATMNSADQGVSTLDSAFKRRWNYEYLKIDISSAVHKDSVISYAGNEVKWGDFITIINDKLKKLGIGEDRLIGPYFIKPSEVESRKAIDKLLLYLWDDVLRHRRDQFFAGDVFTFSDLCENFITDDVLQIGSGLTQYISTAIEDTNEEEDIDNNIEGSV